MKDWIIRHQLQTIVTNEKTPLVRDGDSYALGGATPHSDIKDAIVRCANGAILTRRCYSLDEPTGMLTFGIYILDSLTRPRYIPLNSRGK